MRKFMILFAALWFVLFTLPVLTLDNAAEYTYPPPAENLAEPVSAPESEPATDSQTTISLLDDTGEVIKLKLDEYLAGVVAAEMPALFPTEALKAQAVAARTYAMNKLAGTPPPEHKGAALCASPAHCKIYKPLSSVAVNWGVSREVYTDKITRAVRDTDGEILLYENKPISAVFHSTSSGRTERAADVWGTNVPYLQSVESPGDGDSPRYTGRVEITPREFSENFKKLYVNASFPADVSEWFSGIERSEAGGVKTLKVGGVATTGSIIRSLCGLSSTNFTVSASPGAIVFETKGYGHGVGMSQYGARALAEQGKTYREILSWYYKDIEFGKIKLDS